MESIDTLYSENCKEKFTKVYMFPCMHNFCSKCTNMMKNGAQTICLICSNECHQDDVKRNNFLEKIFSITSQKEKNELVINICELCDTDGSEKQADKYCVECSQYICSKCSTSHVKSKVSKDHQIVDKDNVKNMVIKTTEPYCDKHNTRFSIYCETCDSLICPTCCIFSHSDHDKSDNLVEVFDKSKSIILNKITDINNIINEQNKLFQKNQLFKKKLLQNCDKVQNKIENYSRKLKDQIDFLTKANVDKINKFKNEFIQSFQANLKEITDYIFSLTNLKLYYQEVINTKLNFDIFNLKNELNNNNLIEMIKPKTIPIINLSFQEPSKDILISTQLSQSFKFLKIRDLKFNLNNQTTSSCVFEQKICSSIFNGIDIYDIETGKQKTFIKYSQYIENIHTTLKIIDHGFVFILSTEDDLFIYYFGSYRTNILKLKKYNKTFVRLKRLSGECKITVTFQQTLLVLTETDNLIELSANGDELTNFSIPEAALLSSYYSTAHQLKNGQYVVTSTDCIIVQVSLLDHQGVFIKSFTQPATCYIRTCTDGEKFIFVFDGHIEKITVLSTDLQLLHSFDCLKVENIFYDQVNDKILLVKKNELIFFTYYLNMLVSI